MAADEQSATGSAGAKEDLEKQAIGRIAACRIWKSYIELDLKEGYFFASPHRQRQINSQVQPATQRMLDAPELNTDQAFIICGDFITTIVNAFLPEAEMWCERGPGMFLPGGSDGDIWKSIADKVKDGDRKIFEAMKASNLYPELPKAFNPDLPLGTAALWVDRSHPSRPIVVSAVPLRELEINLGPYGEIDDRFAVRYTRNAYVRELVGEEIWKKMDAKLKKLCEDKPSDRTQVVWGYWRIWHDWSDEVWQHTVMLGNKLIHDVEIKGEGSCPLLVMRFNPTADWPHGIGPLLQGLPTFRQIDELEMMRIDHSSLSMRPPITYPDDTFVNVEQGVEEGMAYPVRPGTAQDVKAIYTPPPAEAANYQYQEKLSNLRKLFFVDHPEQSGDTPPTATQWMDELARAQRRIGTPGLSFWREGPAQIFLRFKHLLEIAGVLPPLQVDGRAVATMPRNPAQAAAEQQEVVKAMQLLTYLAQTFPEEFKAMIDGKSTMQAIIDKARATKLIVFRKPEDVQKMVDTMSKLMGDRPVPSQPGGAPIPGPAA
jgi:hypothetical protein